MRRITTSQYGFEWVDGTAVNDSYSNWATGKPRLYDYVMIAYEMSHTGLVWYTFYCSGNTPVFYICQRKIGNFFFLIFFQLVHSLILSHIDYCNALFYNLPEYLLHKLTKVLYSAVRFIFGLRGSALRKHMLPYLKSLHFLPVKFRIEFKIALLTHKCLHGYAPTYLKNLINSRSVSERYS